jgi:nucleotide-binding universal stress UspA family protein
MKILFATDGSDSARTAGGLLASLALPQEVQMTVLSATPAHHWIETPGSAEVALYPWLVDLATEEEGAARRAAEIAADHFRAQSRAVASSIRRQSPADAILEQAEADGTELIVVGSHGNGTLQRYLVGSVSERVARYAPCSVLVARSDVVWRVLVAVDDSEASDHALDLLARLPLPRQTDVTMLHVLNLRELHTLFALVPALKSQATVEQCYDAYRARGERIVGCAQQRLRASVRGVATEIRTGQPLEQIIAAAWGNETDLIVVGAENRSALGRRFLGCVSGGVLAHAPCSVLVARGLE